MGLASAYFQCWIPGLEKRMGSSRKTVIVVAMAVVLLVVFTPSVQGQDGRYPDFRERTEDSGQDFSWLLLQTLPYGFLNTLPGFGLGSFLQDQIRTGTALALTDSLAWGLLVPGILLLNRDVSAGGGEVPPAVVLVLLGGYGVYAGSRIAGFTFPFLAAFKYGHDPARLTVPVFYNLLPGFGLGSYLQGDLKTARLLRVLDIAASGALGVLSGFALSGEDIPAAAAAIVFIGLVGTSKVGGVVLPQRYREAYARD
jgi:hypothetical protein